MHPCEDLAQCSPRKPSAPWSLGCPGGSPKAEATYKARLGFGPIWTVVPEVGGDPVVAADGAFPVVCELAAGAARKVLGLREQRVVPESWNFGPAARTNFQRYDLR
jgi:hypothetical protein